MGDSSAFVLYILYIETPKRVKNPEIYKSFLFISVHVYENIKFGHTNRNP